MPFAIGGDTPAFPRGGAILVESFDDARLGASAAVLGARLARLGFGAAMATFTRYRLAYALDLASLARLAPVAPDAPPRG